MQQILLSNGLLTNKICLCFSKALVAGPMRRRAGKSHASTNTCLAIGTLLILPHFVNFALLFVEIRLQELRTETLLLATLLRLPQVQQSLDLSWKTSFPSAKAEKSTTRTTTHKYILWTG